MYWNNLSVLESRRHLDVFMGTVRFEDGPDPNGCSLLHGGAPQLRGWRKTPSNSSFNSPKTLVSPVNYGAPPCKCFIP